MNAPVGESRVSMFHGVTVEEAHKVTSISWEPHKPACLAMVDDNLRLLIFTTAGEMQRYFITHPNHKRVASLG